MSFAASTLYVADTGVLLELHRLGYLETLHRLFERVLIPPAVLLELQSLTAPAWMYLTKPSQVVLASISAETNLGHGEPEALAVAVEQNAWVLLDDRANFKMVDRFCQPFSSNTSRNRGMLHALGADRFWVICG